MSFLIPKFVSHSSFKIQVTTLILSGYRSGSVRNLLDEKITPSRIRTSSTSAAWKPRGRVQSSSSPPLLRSSSQRVRPISKHETEFSEERRRLDQRLYMNKNYKNIIQLFIYSWQLC